jgi:hypothetical protein
MILLTIHYRLHTRQSRCSGIQWRGAITRAPHRPYIFWWRELGTRAWGIWQRGWILERWRRERSSCLQSELSYVVKSRIETDIWWVWIWWRRIWRGGPAIGTSRIPWYIYIFFSISSVISVSHDSQTQNVRGLNKVWAASSQWAFPHCPDTSSVEWTTHASGPAKRLSKL